MSKKTFKLTIIVIPAVVVLLNILIIIFPKEVIQAAKEGVVLWLGNVLPSLLPFIIGVNLMSALGVTKFMGKMLEPVMRKLFGIGGAGGFVLAVGLISGYPIGAKTTAALRESGDLDKCDADRLICFVNNSGPLFILGAVAQGMFDNITAGYFLLFVHYLSAIFTGIFFRFVIPDSNRELMPLKRPITERKREAFGAVLSKSVTGGMESILVIGGFIIMFGVAARILDVTNVFGVLEGAARGLNPIKTVSSETYRAVFMSVIEVTNGLKALAGGGITKASLIIAAAAISFGGFSIHAQSLSFISKTDISAKLYFTAKLVQTVFSVLIGMISMPFFYEPIMKNETVEAFKPIFGNGSAVSRFLYSSVFFSAAVIVLLLVIIVAHTVLHFSGKKTGRKKPVRRIYR